MKISKLTLQNEFPMVRSARRAVEHKAMIDLTDDLLLTRQAELLRLRRGSLDDHPRAVSAPDLAIMRRINLDYPFAGSRMLRELLRGEADCPPGYFLPARSLFPPLSFSAPPGTIIR